MESLNDLVARLLAAVKPIDSLAVLNGWFQAYGYWIFFFGPALENIVFTSAIVPGPLLLMFGGYYAGSGSFPMPAFLGMAIAGVWTGDLANYLIGRFFWSKVLRRSRAGRWIERVRPVLQSRGRLFFVLYHFELATRMVGAAAAGTTRLNLWRWLPFDFFGGVLWVCFYGGAGFVFGQLGRGLGETASLQPLQIAFSAVLVMWLVVIAVTIKRTLRAPKTVAPPDGDLT